MTVELGRGNNFPAETKDLERARQSLIEELEAINWYQERIDVSRNESLKKYWSKIAMKRKSMLRCLLNGCMQMIRHRVRCLKSMIK